MMAGKFPMKAYRVAVGLDKKTPKKPVKKAKCECGHSRAIHCNVRPCTHCQALDCMCVEYRPTKPNRRRGKS